MNFDRYDRFVEKVGQVIHRIMTAVFGFFGVVMVCFCVALLAIGFWKFGVAMFTD